MGSKPGITKRSIPYFDRVYCLQGLRPCVSLLFFTYQFILFPKIRFVNLTSDMLSATA